MARNVILRGGERFLPEYTVEQLREIQRGEDDPKASLRLLVWNMYKEGSNITSIAGDLNLSYSTTQSWLRRAMTMGIDGRYDRKAPGKKCKLDSGQLKELRADLAAGPRQCGFDCSAWTGPLAGRHVERKFGVKYSAKAAYNLLRRLGF